MRVRITYTLNDNSGVPLEDMLNWPDLSSVEDVRPHAIVYLDQKYDEGNYNLVSIEEVA